MTVFARPVKWYHKLWLWAIPTTTKYRWVGNECFVLYFKDTHNTRWLWSYRQIVYDVEKHIPDLGMQFYPFDKILKALGGPVPESTFQWGKEE